MSDDSNGRLGGGKSKAAQRNIGRPSKTSRAAIIACAIDQLERDPGATISLNRIAKELGVVTMAIYNYFDSRDELVDVLVDELLDRFTYPEDISGPWQRQIVIWANAMRLNFTERPYLIGMLNREGQSPHGWIQHHMFIFDALEAAGLSGDALIRETFLAIRSLLGAITLEIMSLDISQPRDSDAADLPTRWQQRLVAADRFVRNERYADDMFRHSVERVLDALAIEINRVNVEAELQVQVAAPGASVIPIKPAS